MTGRDSVGEAIVHVREYRGDDPIALEYWARMLAAEVAQQRVRVAELEKVAEEARNAIKTGGFPSLTDRLVELDAVTAADTGNGEA